MTYSANFRLAGEVQRLSLRLLREIPLAKPVLATGQKNSQSMETQIAWAAGLFEGDGCIFAIKKKLNILL